MDHDAATQPYDTGTGAGQRPPQAAREDAEVDLTTQDAEQTEHFQRQRWAEEYERHLAEEAAEALYLADLQAELDVERAQEAYDRANLAQHLSDGGTVQDSDSDS